MRKDGYLEPTDEGASDDHSILDPQPGMKLTAICAKCSGHGGWNLKLNAYGTGKHFRAHCMNCNGWGYVEPKDAGHVHEWEWIRNLGNCYNLHQCKTCGRKWEIDSSG